jgi:hypothetical protein
MPRAATKAAATTADRSTTVAPATGAPATGVTLTTAGSGLLLTGLDPCNEEPAPALRVEPGQSYTEWKRSGVTYVVTDAECNR